MRSHPFISSSSLLHLEREQQVRLVAVLPKVQRQGEFAVFAYPSIVPQVFEELQAGLEKAKRPGSVWTLSVSEQQLKELEGRQSPALALCLKWMQVRKLCMRHHPQISPTEDHVSNAVRP